MSIYHQINEDIIEMIIQGNFAEEELFSGFKQMISDPAIPENAHILINVTRSEGLPSLTTVERVAHLLGRNDRQLSGRVAVLVAHQVRYGRARQLGVFLERYGGLCQPFYERQAAIDWLLSNNTQT